MLARCVPIAVPFTRHIRQKIREMEDLQRSTKRALVTGPMVGEASQIFIVQSSRFRVNNYDPPIFFGNAEVLSMSPHMALVRSVDHYGRLVDTKCMGQSLALVMQGMEQTGALVK